MLGIERNAVDRANLLALWLVIMADAFGTESRIDHIDFLTLRNSVIRALWLANITVDAFIGN
jgi:hypothetical protein